jgi:hypothetical protein
MSSLRSPWPAGALAPAGLGLALLVSLVQLRMDDPWSDGVLLVTAAVPAVLLLLAGLTAAADDPRERAAKTILLVAGLVLAGVAIARVGRVLSGQDYSSGGGTLTWLLAAFTALAAYCYRRSRSVACLLIASLSSVALLLEAVNWIFGTENLDTYRALLAFSFVVLFAAGLATGGRPGTVLVGAAGVTVLVSAYILGFAFALSSEGSDIGWGWELITLLQGLALLGYAAVELEPGPGYLAFFVLAIFVTTAATTGGGGVVFGSEPEEQSHSLVGWPLATGIGTLLAALWGLRRPSSA